MEEENNQDSTPQLASSEPIPQVEANAPSEPAQPVSEPTLVPATPAEQRAQSETPTAQILVNEPLPPKTEPIPSASEGTPATAGSNPNVARDLLVKARAKIQDRKKIKLEKILSELEKKKQITNDEVEKLLHVSDATATRYLSVLKKQGSIKQVGRTGKAVLYTKA